MRSGNNEADDAQLTALGYVPELTRNFTPLSMLGMAFAVLNSWTVLGASLSLALPSGGPSCVLWGLITAGLGNLCLAASMAEFLSAFPAAGGQYHWVAVVSPKAYMAPLSWFTGYMNVFGWIAVVASGGVLGSQLIVGMFALTNPQFELQKTQRFVVYIGYTILAFGINSYTSAILPRINRIALAWSIFGFATICVTLLITSNPRYADAEFVFRYFVNRTGWPDGIAWLLGLLQSGLGLIGYDTVAHMVEEIPNASVEGPRIMIACVTMGTLAGFVFLVTLLFVSGGIDSIDDIITSPFGPLLQILYTATHSYLGATALLILPFSCLLFGSIGTMTTSSRLIWAFARDGGLPASAFFARVHKSRGGVPLNALCLTAVVVMVLGCVFFVSSSVFNAISSMSVIALSISYGMPIAINCLQGRRKLPPRPFTLPEPIGWMCNIIGLIYVLVTSVLFLLPPKLPVDAFNMNYAIVAFAMLLITLIVQWKIEGKYVFQGPKVGNESTTLGCGSSEALIQDRE